MGKKKSRKQPKQPRTEAPEPAEATRAGNKRFLWPLAGLLVLGVGAYAALGQRESGRPEPQQPEQEHGRTQEQTPPSAAQNVPPYHEDPEEAKPFPEVLSPMRFRIPAVGRVYQIASEIPEVLAQQPCYCNCDVYGHGSLLDCFSTDHGGG